MLDASAIFADIAQALPIQVYFPGRVIDQAADEFDDGGSIPDNPGEPTFRACMVQVDQATEAMRQADGYAEGDVRFLILAATLEGGLNTDATVAVDEGPQAGTWLVSAIERDPMSIYFQGRGRRAPTE